MRVSRDGGVDSAVAVVVISYACVFDLARRLATARGVGGHRVRVFRVVGRAW